MNLTLSFIAIAEAAAKQQAQQLNAAESSEVKQASEQAEGGNDAGRDMRKDALPMPKLYCCSVIPLSCIEGTDAIAV
ncbi:MAG TPA: hypothetical protein V6C85_11690 [Allocoleopsis sp.]